MTILPASDEDLQQRNVERTDTFPEWLKVSLIGVGVLALIAVFLPNEENIPTLSGTSQELQDILFSSEYLYTELGDGDRKSVV